MDNLRQVNVRLDKTSRSIIRQFMRSDGCSQTDVIRKALRLLKAADYAREVEVRRAAEMLNEDAA
jgi:Arc/MetJ-type ribon-helix-helix transcriptional regulator